MSDKHSLCARHAAQPHLRFSPVNWRYGDWLASPGVSEEWGALTRGQDSGVLTLFGGSACVPAAHRVHRCPCAAQGPASLVPRPVVLQAALLSGLCFIP